MNEVDNHAHVSMVERLSGLEASLRKGVDASRKIVKIRGKASRIQETLDRISNTAVAISSTLRPLSAPQQNILPLSPTPSRGQTQTAAYGSLPYQSPGSYGSQSSAYGSQTVPFENASDQTMSDDLTQLFSGDIDIFDTLGDMNFDFNDFTAF